MHQLHGKVRDLHNEYIYDDENYNLELFHRACHTHVPKEGSDFSTDYQGENS